MRRRGERLLRPQARAAIALGLLLLVGTSAVMAQSGFTLPRARVANGGDTALTSGSFSLSGTIGQFEATEPLTSGSFELTGGFWHAPDDTPTPTATSTGTPASAHTPTATPTSTPSSTPTGTPLLSATPTVATPTATATPPTTPTTTAIGALPVTATATRTATAAGAATGTVTAAPTSTAMAAATPPPGTAGCNRVEAVCHADLPAPGAAGGNTVSGVVQPGPCVPAGKPNCVDLTVTGSFQVSASLAGLPEGAEVLLRIPVETPTGLAAGVREVACGTVRPGGTLSCSTLVAEPGTVPRVGAAVELRVSGAGVPAPVASPALPPLAFPQPLPPPVALGSLPLLPPPPPLLVPRSLAPAAPGAAPSGAEVPLIPEADSLTLLGLSLVALAGLLVRGRREPRQ